MHNRIEMMGQLTNQSGLRISTRLKIENNKKKKKIRELGDHEEPAEYPVQ